MSLPQSSSTPLYFQTMSTAPPAPQPSNPPPSLSSDTHPTTTQQSESKSKPKHFPDPRLRLELRDLSHDSTDVFLSNFRSSKDFAELVHTVLRLLYTTHSISQSESTQDSATAVTRPAPTTPNVPGTRSVTLILRDMDGVAYTTGKDLDDDHKEIHLSLSYMSHVAKSQNPTRHELLGVVCHELVHCFQWNAQGTAPGGLIEGIADWVRLNAGFVPPHWKKDGNGDWDRGYQNTGYFLDWIEKTKGQGSIYRLNQALADKKYHQDHFWADLFGEDVDSLYAHYQKALKKEQEEASRYGDLALRMNVQVRSATRDTAINSAPGASQ